VFFAPDIRTTMINAINKLKSIINIRYYLNLTLKKFQELMSNEHVKVKSARIVALPTAQFHLLSAAEI